MSDDYRDAFQANVWARRVGMDRIVGYLSGGMNAWGFSGRKIGKMNVIPAEDLHDLVTGTDPIVLVDVRASHEFKDSHVEGAANIPAPDMRTRYKELQPEKPTILICSAGNRSSLAGSILKQHGFREIYILAGGMTGYSASGFAKECAVCENPHGSRSF